MVVFGLCRTCYRGGFYEKLLEISPVSEPMPGSKVGPLQATSETISDGDSVSEITDIRWKTNLLLRNYYVERRQE